MKKTRRKTRWLKIVAFCLGVIVLLTGILVGTNPEVLYYPQTTAPASWFIDPHLERTQDGILLLRFAPSARMRNFYGLASFISSGLLINANGRTADPGTAEMSFHYPWLARLSALANETHANIRRNDLIFRLPDGYWVFPFVGITQYRYVDGVIREVGWRPLTADEVNEHVRKGEKISGHSMIFDFSDTYTFTVVDEGKITREEMRQDTLDTKVLRIVGGGQETTVYEPGDEIPLCDEETEARFLAWKQNSYHAHLCPDIGTVIPDENL
ncbi:MAG: hypothetical protein IJ189_10715 [Clostridia bacterium]|nr:hypothetical protein [Clostridia bacterium]